MSSTSTARAWLPCGNVTEDRARCVNLAGRRGVGLSFGAAVGAAAIATSALAAASAAQAQTAAAPRGTDRFALSVRSDATYDGNVAGGDSTIASLRGLKPADTSYDLGTTLKLQLPSARSTLFLVLDAEARRYARNK